VIRVSALLLALLSGLLSGCTHDPRDTRSLATLDVDRSARPVFSNRWRRDLANRSSEHGRQEFASAAISETGTRLFVGSRYGKFYALERGTGHVLWEADLGSVSSQPLVYEGRIYVGTDDGSLVCLSTLDGKQKWRYATKGPVLQAPVVSGELVVFANEADRVIALDRRSGKFRWQYKSDTPEEYTLRGHAGVTLVGELAVSGFANGNLVALRVETGSVAWITSLSGGSERFIDVDSTPVAVGESLYASSSAGGVFALDGITGRIKWRLPLTGAGPIATDGEAIYFGAANEGIYAVELSGHVIWRQGTDGGGEPAPPVLNGDYLFYSLAESGLFVADKRTGAVRQFFDPGFGVSAAPTIDSGELYVLSNGATLYALGVKRF
jgi:outer membrane protein assembly factor BamB